MTNLGHPAGECSCCRCSTCSPKSVEYRRDFLDKGVGVLFVSGYSRRSVFVSARQTIRGRGLLTPRLLQPVELPSTPNLSRRSHE